MSQGINRERLRGLLIEKNRSARDVSRKAELGETAVKDILSGKSKRPEFDTLLKIATELGVEVSDFTASGPIPGPPRATQRSDDVKIVPRVLEVRYRVRAGQWQQVEFEEPPEDIGYPVVPNPRFAEWPQWLEKVEGDSVNEKIPDGFYIHVVDALEMGYAPKTGHWVVVERWRDQGAIRERTVKQVEVVPGNPDRVILWPRSSNPIWKEAVDLGLGGRPGEDEIEARIVGLVIGAYDPDFPA